METASNNDLLIESLETRRLMSTVAYADFNKDGRVDKAEITNSTTITVSLGKSDGSYAVSAVLTTTKSYPVTGLNVSDVNGDGKLDITAGGTQSNRFYTNTWLGNGDGTFGARITDKSAHIPKWWV